jgi:hypothetical protein
VLARLIRRGGRWYFGKMKQIDSDATRTQANRTLLTLLTSATLGALTFVSCILLCVNFTIRIWALGLIVKPDEVRYGGTPTDNRVNCSFGTPNCLTMKPQFAIAVENLEQVTGFMMQIVVLMASGLLVCSSNFGLESFLHSDTPRRPTAASSFPGRSYGCPCWLASPCSSL